MEKLTKLKEAILFVEAHWAAVVRFFVTGTVLLLMALIVVELLLDVMHGPDDHFKLQNASCTMYRDGYYICG